MNRHHPYGGYDGPRRGGPPGPFGPDRSHRFPDRGGPPRGRGGFRGGRGGGGPFGGGYGGGGPPAYDQGPPQGDMGGYNDYDSGPAQDAYYQNGNYNAGMPEQYGPPDSPSSYNQGFGNLEDGPGNYSRAGGFGRGGKRSGPIQHEKEDKVHDSIIEERIQRERPCRTLFIRNIKYETSSEDVRHLFEEHGEIRTFFDLIANRGMVFVTYYDLRAAERARERLQGSQISGRPIDVHYSLPRDDQRGADKEKNQGTLLVTLRNSASGQSIDDNEVRRKFQQFGDVKAVRLAGDREDQRYVEFYDTRACEEAHDRLRHQGLQDGVMEIVFASDLDDPRGQSPRRGGNSGGFERNGREWEDFGHRGRRGGHGGSHGSSHGGGHGGHGGHGGRGRGRGRGSWGSDNDWDRRGGDWGRHPDRDRGRTFDDGYGRGGGRGGGGGFEDRFDHRGPGAGGFAGPPPPPPSAMAGPGPMGPGPYGGPPPPIPPANFAQPPAAASAQPPDDRLEQAKKVQQLLAALKQPGQPGASVTTAPTPSGPPPRPPMPSAPGQPSYYGAPPPIPRGYPGAVPPPPPPGPGGYPPPNVPQTTPAPASLSGAPPSVHNIMALLQGQGQPHQATPPAPTSLPPNTYGMPPQATPPAPVPGINPLSPNGQQGYQQLMAYLSQKRPQ